MQREQPWFTYLQVVLKCVEHQRCRITAPHRLSVHGHRYLSKMQWLNLFFFFFKYCCSKKLFIYLDVTDYLKTFRFLFSLRCSVLFSFVITMKWLTSLIYCSNYYYYYYYYYYCNDVASIDVFCFLFFCFILSSSTHVVKWCSQSTLASISVNVVIPIDDRWNVVKLKTKKPLSFPKHWSLSSF